MSYKNKLLGGWRRSPLPVDPLALRVQAEAIRIMYANLPNILVSVALMVGVMVWVMWDAASHVTLLAWAATVLAIASVEMQLSRSFARRKPAEMESLNWGRYYTWVSLVNGVAWGSASVLFFVADSAVLQVFLFTCMVGVATASIIQHAYWLESYYAYTVPLLALSGLRILWEGGAAYQGLAVLTLLLLVIAIQMARDAEKSVLSAIRLRFQNIDLIEELRREKEKAEIASRDKTRFLASASHDLRQPVHALTLFAEALQPELTTEKGNRLLGNIGRSIEAINQLLSSLLDISKLDANIVQAHPANISLGALLRQIDAEYAPQAQGKGLAWQVPESALYVYSDPALLDVILRNLVSNAIRYTPQGAVAIELEQHGSKLHIVVADSGIGIAQDQQQEIFREFYQVENAARERSKGLGLGLAIVERVAALLHHRIAVQSAPGKGSRFTVVLPLGEKPAQPLAETAHGAVHSDVGNITVLVIDDDKDVLESMRVVMQGWGCNVLLAETLQQALDMLQKGAAPHALITDYRLREGVNGVETIRRLQEFFGKVVPALIITGDTAPERLREVQASSYSLMHKPVQPAKLRAWLRNVQRRR